MAKKDDVKKESEDKVESSQLIDVQMTKEELDEYAAYAAKKKDEAEEAPAKEKKEVAKFRMNLLYQHNINGVKYGPGEAIVPEYHVGLIEQGENQSRQQEIKLHTSSNRMMQVLSNGAVVPVRADTKIGSV